MKAKVKTNYLKCWDTEEVVCPFCGYVHQDSWEFDFDCNNLKDVVCDNCSSKFEVYKEIAITYTSCPKDSTGYWEEGDAFENGIKE